MPDQKPLDRQLGAPAIGIATGEGRAQATGQAIAYAGGILLPAEPTAQRVALRLLRGAVAAVKLLHRVPPPEE